MTKTIDRESFMDMHVEFLSGVLELVNSTEKLLVIEMWKSCQATYRTTHDQRFETVALKDDKETWSKVIGCSLGTINNTITKLVNKGAIKCVSRSVYTMNKEYFFILSTSKKYSFHMDYIINEGTKITFIREHKLRGK